MNLGFVDRGTVLHEFGHSLGLIHEHQSPFKGGFEWNRDEVSTLISHHLVRVAWGKGYRYVVKQLSMYYRAKQLYILKTLSFFHKKCVSYLLHHLWCRTDPQTMRGIPRSYYVCSCNFQASHLSQYMYSVAWPFVYLYRHVCSSIDIELPYGFIAEN